MKPTALPEPASPVTVEIGRNDPWLIAAQRKNWHQRAAAFDDLIVDQLAGAIATDGDPRAATGLALLQMTAAVEQIGDVEIRSADAAICYLLSTHGGWREAARLFLMRNAINIPAVLRSRPGLRLIYTVAIARGLTLVPPLPASAGVH